MPKANKSQTKKSNNSSTKIEVKDTPVNEPKSNRRDLKLSGQRRNIIIVLAVIFIVVGGLVYYERHKSSTNTKNAGQSQINDTVNKVGKLFLLPTGEQPTLAIVNDASKYSNVSFFKNAANGDRVLIYAQAREAILYRPSINKIIAVAPLNPSSQ